MHLALAVLALAAAVLGAEEDFYKILKVPRSATDAEVRIGAVCHRTWPALPRRTRAHTAQQMARWDNYVKRNNIRNINHEYFLQFSNHQLTPARCRSGARTGSWRARFDGARPQHNHLHSHRTTPTRTRAMRRCSRRSARVRVRPVDICLSCAAYEVLSDEEKRQIYDADGKDGLKRHAEQQQGGGHGSSIFDGARSRVHATRHVVQRSSVAGASNRSSCPRCTSTCRSRCATSTWAPPSKLSLAVGIAAHLCSTTSRSRPSARHAAAPAHARTTTL